MTPDQIGQFIRDTRKARRLTQPELATVAGVGLRFLVELEGGKPSCQLGKALSVLESLGCRVSIVPATGDADPPSRKRQPD